MVQSTFSNINGVDEIKIPDDVRKSSV
ncbi:MAG: DUF6612 family protein, partial [Bacillus sp. (in: firmicutes)]